MSTLEKSHKKRRKEEGREARGKHLLQSFLI